MFRTTIAYSPGTIGTLFSVGTGTIVAKIPDFSRVQADKIEIFATGFGGGINRRGLECRSLRSRFKTLDSGDRLIYTITKGALFFESDGKARGRRFQ